MSKKTPVKKSKRRLKKTARRSLAAILMISAIGVAAIPVPENIAAEEGSGSGETVSGNTTAADYSYKSENYSDSVFSDADGKPLNLSRPSEGSIYKTHYITNVKGVDTLEWQFQYFTKKDSSGYDRGIICGYNASYPQAELTVSTNPISDYVVVPIDDVTVSGNDIRNGSEYDFEDYMEAKAETSFTLLGGPIRPDPADYPEFVKYFPKEFDRQMGLYDKYEEDLEKWERQEIEDKPTAPTAITRKASEFGQYGGTSDELWRTYYCDNPPAELVKAYPPMNKNSLAGYRLELVANSDLKKPDSTDLVYSYVPKRITIVEGNPDDDERGYRIGSKTNFIGVGDYAFQGVQNVQSVILPDALAYIGDYAFAGSFIRTITMTNVQNVGNYAFKECPYLYGVTFLDGVKNIGKEAFYGITGLTEVVFPASIGYIGPAAFAGCRQLNTVDFSKAALEVVVDDYAFYNDIALGTVKMNIGESDTMVNISTIGTGAFAVKDTVSGSAFTEFTFPSDINQNKGRYNAAGTKFTPDTSPDARGLGDYVLAGRTNLQKVTMPLGYGSTEEIRLPNDIFLNCINLGQVEFPANGTCGFVQYNEDLFDTVQNAKFYVQGPETVAPSNDVPAYPRQSTWMAKTAVSEAVPYIYYDKNGKRNSEISDGDYLECIDENGVLTSCIRNPNVTVPKKGISLVIPAEVGGVMVTGIASDCFSDDVLNQAISTLTILDNSQLATINDSVFANWGNLEKVYLGNSVRTIGKNAFQGCKNLKDVTFNTPESAAADFSVGEGAFKTNGMELTFHGMINANYAPYSWAMNPENTLDSDDETVKLGARVCYKSLTPTCLTVMYDNGTGQVTLLDYPKYEQVEKLLGEAYATRNGYDWQKDYSSAAEYYREYMEQTYYNWYSGEQYAAKRQAFVDAWANASDAEEVYKNFEVYGPWVDKVLCDNIKNGTAKPSKPSGGGGDTGANDTNGLFDWLFEPMEVYAAPSSDPMPYFDRYEYSVYTNDANGTGGYGPYQSTTEDEKQLINATKNVRIPDGVTSIDVYKYINGNGEEKPNSYNVTTYLKPGNIGLDNREMYDTSDLGASNAYADRESNVKAGLFSGKYKDYKKSGEGEEKDSRENLEKGNDRLLSIDLNGVTYLPDYAFDSCENLHTVKIGPACTNIGTLPFRGCTSLTNVEVAEGNEKYSSANRIIYSNNGTTTEGVSLYKIEECLETRGKDNDNIVIDSGIDEKIAGVNAIADGAFEACNYLEEVHLGDAANLIVIPERCFHLASALDRVELPASVNKIDKDAFTRADKLRTIKIPGKEVFISTNAFRDNQKDRTDIVTFEDSSARRYADTYSEQFNLKWQDIGDLWEVRFFDMDGTPLSDPFTVAHNTRLTEEQIPPDPTREGYTFVEWVGTGGTNPREDPITQPTSFFAQYNSTGGMVDGKYPVEFIDGVDGRALVGDDAVMIAPGRYGYLIEAGTTFAESGYKMPERRDEDHAPIYKFVKWHDGWTEQTVINSPMQVIALYEVDKSYIGTTSGGTTNTSGGTTTNSSGSTTTSTTTTSSTLSTSTTSSSTSSSSTSTSSTTSGSGSTAANAAKYAVFVENGSGSGYYSAGDTVIISANVPAAGMKFSNWTTSSNGVTLMSNSLSATTFTMPANNVTVTANYVADTTPTSTAGAVGGTTTPDDGSTRVDITKPGISNKDLATADVNGSTDNFIVKITETDEATQAVAAALTNKYNSLDNILYYAMDISLYDSTGTTKITDTTGLSIDITIPIPDALVAYGGNNMAGAVVNGNQLENLDERFTTVNGVPMVTFTATHFSPYTIYVDTGNLSAQGMLDVTPKTGDPIHPKWFLSIGLACLSIILFIKKDKTAKKMA